MEVTHGQPVVVSSGDRYVECLHDQPRRHIYVVIEVEGNAGGRADPIVGSLDKLTAGAIKALHTALGTYDRGAR